VASLSRLSFFANPETLVFYFAFAALSAISTATWCEGKGSNQLSLVQISFLFAGLYIIPTIVEGPPNVGHAYDFLTFPVVMMRSGHWVNAYSSFLNWPGSWILYSEFLTVTGIQGFVSITETFPILWQAIYVILIYVVCVKANGRKGIAAIGVWAFLLGNWLDQSYLSDQSLGLALFFVGVIMVLDERTPVTRRRTIVAIVFVVAALAISHILSVLVMEGAILAISFFRKPLRIVATFGGIVLASWNIVAVGEGLSSFIRAAVSSLAGFSDWFQSGVVQPLSYQNAVHAAATRLELIDVMAFGALALSGLLLQFRSKRNSRSPTLRSALALEVAIVAVVIATNTAGGNELFQRAFLFSLVPVCILMSVAVKDRRIMMAFLVFSFVAAPLNLMGQYNTFATSNVTPPMTGGMLFLNRHAVGGTIMGALFPGMADGGLFGKLQGQYQLLSFTKSPCNSGTLTPIYVSITPADYATLSYDFGDTSTLDALNTSLSGSAAAILTYSANGVLLYVTNCGGSRVSG
jgi:hypothetical protein